MAGDLTKHSAAKRPHEDESKPWRNWKRKSSLNVFLTVEVPTDGHIDLLEFLLNTKNNIHDIIAEELRVRKALKFYLTVRPQLSRIDPDGVETISTPYLCSTPSIVLQSTDITNKLTKPEAVSNICSTFMRVVDLGSVSIVSWNVNSI